VLCRLSGAADSNGADCGFSSHPLSVAAYRYKRLLTLSFVEHGLKDVKWCTGPDCENGVQCDILQTYLDVLVPTVICDCKQAFCFGCGESESHQPAVCGLVKKWAKKMKDDSETAKVSSFDFEFSFPSEFSQFVFHFSLLPSSLT